MIHVHGYLGEVSPATRSLARRVALVAGGLLLVRHPTRLRVGSRTQTRPAWCAMSASCTWSDWSSLVTMWHRVRRASCPHGRGLRDGR